jgi:hypothetical protein
VTPAPATSGAGIDATSLGPRLHAAVAGDRVWDPALREAEARGAGLHLAVFVEPYLGYVLAGQKTVESRFGVRRAPPFGCVEAGDIVLLKSAAGPVVGLARVTHVWSYRLGRGTWQEIRERFGPALCLDDEEAFIAARASRRFATLMRFADVLAVAPIPVIKRDRRGWVVVRAAGAAPFLPGFEPGA